MAYMAARPKLSEDSACSRAMFEHTLNIACIASHTKHVAIVALFKVLWQSVQDPIERQVTSAWSRRGVAIASPRITAPHLLHAVVEGPWQEAILPDEGRELMFPAELLHPANPLVAQRIAATKYVPPPPSVLLYFIRDTTFWAYLDAIGMSAPLALVNGDWTLRNRAVLGIGPVMLRTEELPSALFQSSVTIGKCSSRFEDVMLS